MIEALYPILSHAWGGLAVSAAVGVAGLLMVSVARWRGGWPVRWLGYLVAVTALLLTVGSTKAMIGIWNAERRFPPPGTLVDVGGFRMHIVAEGDAHGGPTLIWIAGAHAEGNAVYNFQKAFRGETRTIIFDRPGTGWSDPGPFPRRTALEAEELATLLERAGEHGPFILIGHSYGGLLAANYARRHKDRTAAVVLLDATPPDAFVYAPLFGEPAARQGVLAARESGLMKAFGLYSRADRPAVPRDTVIARIIRQQDSLLADVRPAMDARASNPASDFAWASIFTEFTGSGMSAAAPDLVVYDGELNGIPVYVVVPEGGIEDQIGAFHLPDAVAKRALNFFARSRVRYMQVSDKALLIHPPNGSSHNYPYEHPDFVIDVVRRVLATARAIPAAP